VDIPGLFVDGLLYELSKRATTYEKAIGAVTRRLGFYARGMPANVPASLSEWSVKEEMKPGPQRNFVKALIAKAQKEYPNKIPEYL
jgi:hypothetical protein